MDVFEELDQLIQTKENYVVVDQQLHRHCRSCSLSLANPKNPGFISEGTLLARVAFVGGAPSRAGMTKKKPFVGAPAEEIQKWLPIMGLTKEEIFFTNAVQCAPPLDEKGDPRKIHSRKELEICFPDRTLRLLKSMPNLEVVCTLGWVSIAAILGIPEAGPKTHEGFWFGSERLPGVAIYSLPDPEDFHDGMSWDEKGRLRQVLEQFAIEYTKDKKVLRFVNR